MRLILGISGSRLRGWRAEGCLGRHWLSSLSPTLLLTFKLLALKVILEFSVTAVMRGVLRCRPTISPWMDHWQKREKRASPFSLNLYAFWQFILIFFTTLSLFSCHFSFFSCQTRSPFIIPSRLLYPSCSWSWNSFFFLLTLHLFDWKVINRNNHKTNLFTIWHEWIWEGGLMELLALIGLLDKLQTPRGWALWWLATDIDTRVHTQSVSEAGSWQCWRAQQTNLHWFNHSMDLCLKGEPGLIWLYGVTIFLLLANSQWPSRHQVIASCNISHYFHGWTEVHEQCWADRSIFHIVVDSATILLLSSLFTYLFTQLNSLTHREESSIFSTVIWVFTGVFSCNKTIYNSSEGKPFCRALKYR